MPVVPGVVCEGACDALAVGHDCEWIAVRKKGSGCCCCFVLLKMNHIVKLKVNVNVNVTLT